MLEDIPANGQPPEIVTARGPLTPAASKAIIRRVKRFSGVTDILERQALALQAVSGSPLVAGNRVTLLLDGPATYASMLDAIRKARDHINFETFIFDDDETGRLFADEFLKKQSEGVQVNIIYDHVGSVDTPQGFFERFRDNGINVLEFNPSGLLPRDHRKVLVVDGMIAFTGGVNISHVYSSGPSGIFRERETRELKGKVLEAPWRDTHVRVEGPAAAEFQRLFLETWEDQKGPELPEKNYFQPLSPKGADLVQVIGSTPGELNRITFIMYVAAFLNSQRSIHLTTAYFVPDEQAVASLIDAAGRGLEVKIILPEVSDSKFALFAGHYYYSDLLRSGVKLYERRHRMLHAKTLVVDRVWSTIGSTNMDLLSFLHNNEINAVVIGTGFASEMEALFESDLGQSHEILLEEWRERPLFYRIREWLAHLFRRYL